MRYLHAACRQFVLQTVQRQVRLMPNPLHDERSVRIKNRPPMSAHPVRLYRSGRAVALVPLDHRSDGHPEPGRNYPAALARNYSGDNAFTKIIR